MIKVLFYHSVDLFNQSFDFSYERDGIKTVYPALASVYIKTYIELNYPDIADKIH